MAVAEDARLTQAEDAAAFERIVRARRSVRKFTDTPIPENVMRQCLELALRAPNSSNLQTWQLFWVRSPEKKARLAHACLGQNAATTAAELVVVAATPARWREHCRMVLEGWPEGKPPKVVREYYGVVAKLLYTQGPLGMLTPLRWAIFNGVGLFRPAPREPMGRSGMAVWAVKSAALAAENFVLGLRAHGFDTCMMEGMDSARVRRIVGARRGTLIPMVIGCGERGPDGVYSAQYRLPSERTIHEI